MKLVVGLGNVGKEHQNTVHNIGFMVVEELAERLGVCKFKRECDAMVAETNLDGQKVILALPTTYMNRSGIAVKSLQSKYKIGAENIIIVQDDIDVAAGIVRLRTCGSAGTHNGLKSIHEYISGTQFVRVRVGAGKPNNGQDLTDYVLSIIPKNSEVWQGIEKATDAVEALVRGTEFSVVQNKFSK